MIQTKQKIGTKVPTATALPASSNRTKTNNQLGLLLVSLVGVGLLLSQPTQSISLEQELQELIDSTEKGMCLEIINGFSNSYRKEPCLSAFTFKDLNYTWCILKTDGNTSDAKIGYLPRNNLVGITKAEELENLLNAQDFLDSFEYFLSAFEYRYPERYSLWENKEKFKRYIAAKLLTLYWQTIN